MEGFLILGLPLFSAIFCGIFNKKISFRFASLVSSVSLIASCFLAVKILLLVQFQNMVFHQLALKWFSLGYSDVSWAVYVDKLTAVMFVVVTLVSSIVHIYSYGYMKKDENGPRFMSYLSLFTFFMIVLVSADNFLQLFVGWEGVGLCSYLLIGFWYKKESASSAAMKAFIVNRVGDFAFIIGILFIIFYVGSVNFQDVFKAIPVIKKTYLYLFGFELPLAEIIAIFLFIGCMGKSAQIGLHVWLPDAMEGPTPVSALIHAATMVTAGVFLVARASPIFELAPNTSCFILYVGAVTCLFAASIAVAQDDIKKIIAYSTCSQLGYMFMAAGAFAYNAGIFHLVTHAFFKAMLFLSAGIVIHAVHEQDINKMGGLRRAMPITYLFFIIGSLAIMGFYPFAGYFSKDLILESVYESGGIYPFGFGILAAFFTAIYSMKIIIKVFHGKPYKKKAKEWAWSMVPPLFILAFASVTGGLYLFDYFVSVHPHVPLYIKYMPSAAGSIGVISGIILYGFGAADSLSKGFSGIYNILRNKYYFDEFYDKSFVRITHCLAQLSKGFDKIIDYCPNSMASISDGISCIICKIQNGYIFTYVFYLLFGVLGVMLTWILKFYL